MSDITFGDGAPDDLVRIGDDEIGDVAQGVRSRCRNGLHASGAHECVAVPRSDDVIRGPIALPQA